LITLRESKYEELATIVEMEKQSHAMEYIHGASLEEHESNFANRNIIYLTIVKADVGLAGFLVLVLGEERGDVEFRRILIDENHKGIGQAAIQQMEMYCKTALGAKRIWLDVYDDNEVAVHIYQKLGYRQFKMERHGERNLHFYEKALKKNDADGS